MSNFNKLSHTVWQCRYHIVFCPKYRYKVLVGRVEEFVRNEFYKLASYKKIKVVEINVQADHVHVVLEIPPNEAVSSVMGYLKGKLAIKLYMEYRRYGRVVWTRSFWSRGYCVSTVGLDEEKIRKYVRWQQSNEARG